MTLETATSSSIDQERFSELLATQRSAFLRAGAPSLATRRSDLKKFKAALIALHGANDGGRPRRRALRFLLTASVSGRAGGV